MAYQFIIDFIVNIRCFDYFRFYFKLQYFILHYFIFICISIKNFVKNNKIYIISQGRKAEEQRSQRLTAELGQFRHEAERRLQEKEEEIEAIR